jgi:hypothetical protein
VSGITNGSQVDEKKIRAQLKKWQERLLDLTKGNPLLGLNRSRVSKVRVTSPALNEIFSQVVVAESEIRLPMAVRRSQPTLLDDSGPGQMDGYEIEPGDVEFEATPVELARKLRRIRDNARTLSGQTGTDGRSPFLLKHPVSPGFPCLGESPSARQGDFSRHLCCF